MQLKNYALNSDSLSSMISMDESLLQHGGFELILVLQMTGMVYEDESHRIIKKIYNGMDVNTVCPRSSDPSHIVSYCTKLVTTSWTYSG